MGVQGLWSVIESTGQPIPANSLRGKVLAIDVSIWLHQSVKGYRDKEGNPLPNAHLLGVFNRICKLLNYGVRPVFVFDGGVPALKRQTMSLRKQRKLEAQDKSDLTRTKLLTNYLRQHIQMTTKQALPTTLRLEACLKSLSSKKKGESSTARKGKSWNDNEVDSDLEELRQNMEEAENIQLAFMSSSEDEGSSDSSGDYCQGRNYSEHFSSITSPNFDSLPLESQHEILFQMQESKKTNSWNKMHEMPRDPNDFSSFQMDRLVKRRFLQKKIQSVQQEMGQRHIHVQNLDDLAEFEAEFGTPAEETQIIGSKEKGALLLKPKENPSLNPLPGPSREKTEPEVITIDDYVEDWSSEDEIVQTKEVNVKLKQISEETVKKQTEEEADIELAIKLSLEESNSKVEETTRSNASLVQEESSSIIRKKSSSESESPSKTYSATASEAPLHKGFQQAEDIFSPMYKFLGWVGYSDKVSTSPVKIKDSLPMPSVPEESSSGSGSDFEEVEETVGVKSVVLVEEPETPESSSIPILLNMKKSLSKEEDIFAHIFKTEGSDTSDEVRVLSHESNGNAIERSSIPIVLNFNKNLGKEDDIFADIFEKDENEVSDTHQGNGIAEIEQLELISSESQPEVFTREAETTIEKPGTIMVEETGASSVVPDTEASKIESKLEEPEITTPNDEIEWDSDPEVDSDLEEMLSQEQLAATTTESIPEAESHAAPKVRNQQITRTLGMIPSDQDSSVRMITAEFLQAQQQLNTQQGKLRTEKGFQERLATSITDQMYIESQELLTLFGIPYVVSPMEAEAQCAFLDTACLTDGTITDDSDVWLFGGRRVYKNFFAHGDKHVEFYQYATIVQKLNLTREKLVLMALLTGSDYTNGVEGAGPVTALEIISEFPSDSTNPFDGLVKFRDWWESSQVTKDIIDAENKVREKLRKLKLPAGFPNSNIYDAYMQPTIDSSTERFRWGNPDLDSLRKYTKSKFGWDELKCNTVLKPILKNFECQAQEISRQTTLDNFITIGKSSHFLPGTKRKIQSRRLARAMKKLKRGVGAAPDELKLSSDSDSDESGNESKSRNSKKPSKSKKARAISSATESDEDQPLAAKKKPTRGKKSSDELKARIQNASVRIPKKTQDIPVLQKTKEECVKGLNKLKAIEVFKKNKNVDK